MKLLIHSQTWTVPRLKFGNGISNFIPHFTGHVITYPWRLFKNAYLRELLNLRVLKFSPVNEINIFQCMGKIFCVGFQRVALELHLKYLTHTLKDGILMQHWNFFFFFFFFFLQHWNFNSSYKELFVLHMFLKGPPRNGRFVGSVLDKSAIKQRFVESEVMLTSLC